MRWMLAAFVIFVAGGVATFLIAGSLASLIACGGVACAMSEEQWRHVAFPIMILCCLIGGGVIGLALGWAATEL